MTQDSRQHPGQALFDGMQGEGAPVNALHNERTAVSLLALISEIGSMHGWGPRARRTERREYLLTQAPRCAVQSFASFRLQACMHVGSDHLPRMRRPALS